VEDSLIDSSRVSYKVKHVFYGNCVKLSELNSWDIKLKTVDFFTLNLKEFYIQFEEVKDSFKFIYDNNIEPITFGEYSISKTKFKDIIELD